MFQLHKNVGYHPPLTPPIKREGNQELMLQCSSSHMIHNIGEGLKILEKSLVNQLPLGEYIPGNKKLTFSIFMVYIRYD